LPPQPVTNNVLLLVPVYVSSSIENATPEVLTMTYDMTFANIIPAASAFSVIVNSVSRSISSVIVSGMEVVLNLSSPVEYGDIITVSYTKPSENQLQATTGEMAETLSPQTVSNNVADIPTYVTSSVENANPSVLIMSYDLTLTNIVPASLSFTVSVNTLPVNVSLVTISGSSVLLTLASPVATGDAVTVAYTQPATNLLQTAEGGIAATIGNQTVLNNVGVIIPIYISSVVENITPSVLTLTYSLTLDNTIIPAPSSYEVKVNSIVRSVTSVSISGTKIDLNLSSPVSSGNVVTVAYTQPATNPVQAASGGLAATFTAKTVTNNVLAVPVYLSSVIENAAPSSLVMTYSLALSTRYRPAASSFTVIVNSVARTVSSVSLSGTKVTLRLSSAVISGDVVTVSYTPPATNPLQTSARVKAEAISDKAVTNNVVPVPVYVSSSIENSAPAVIVMNYSLSLANIVPSVSAFRVFVNSVSRGVGSVSISGTKVLLTLTSGVEFGNLVTVSYTTPATNPLQTDAGGKAESLSAQTVTFVCVPVTIITTSVSSRSPTSATGGGNIIPDGGSPVSSSGLCWSTSPNPTIADFKTNDGSLTGSFTNIITGLNENVTYYIRAYAINCYGTGYGSDVIYNSPTIYESYQLDMISVYPNPVSSYINIDYYNENYVTVNILNSVGLIVHQENVKAPKQIIDFSRYLNGMYILEFVKSSGATKRIKVLKD